MKIKKKSENQRRSEESLLINKEKTKASELVRKSKSRGGRGMIT